jgi:hypothetical protein
MLALAIKAYFGTKQRTIKDHMTLLCGKLPTLYASALVQSIKTKEFFSFKTNSL